MTVGILWPQGLGIETAQDRTVFAELLPELVSGTGYLWKFGVGLARGPDDPKAVWSMLVEQFIATAKESRNAQVLCGFLEGVHEENPDYAQEILDEALRHAELASWIPVLQCAVPIDGQGVERLMDVVDRAPVWRFGCLAGGRASDPIAPCDLKSLLLAIAAQPGGFTIAADILAMRIYSERARQ